MVASNIDRKQVDQAIARGLEIQKRAVKFNSVDRFIASPIADVVPSTDDEIIEFAAEGIAALAACKPIGAYAALGLIITELKLRKQQ